MPKTKKESKMEREIHFGGVSLVDKALFAKHLSVMLKSGIPISEALIISADSAKGKLSGIIKGLLGSVEAGNPLSEGLSRYTDIFSGLFINAVKAGETSGTLVENLENVSSELEKEKDLRAKIQNAMVYPIVVLIAAFVLGMVLSFVVLPKITPLFEGLKVDLPITTRALIWFSHFIQANGLVFFLSVMGFVIFMSWLVGGGQDSHAAS